MSSLSDIRPTVAVQSWIDTSSRAICADPERIKAPLDESVKKGPTLLHHVLTETYPALVEAGYELPLNLVVDLTYLYVEGRDARFSPPKNWPKGVLKLDLAQRYCDFLKREIEDGPLAHVLTTIKRAQRQRLRRDGLVKDSASAKMDPAMIRRPGETYGTAGLVTFLELCARSLLRHPKLLDPPKSAEVSRDVVKALRDGAFSLSVPSSKTDRQALELIRFFLESLFPKQSIEQIEVFEEIFEYEANLLLMVASTRVPAGAEGLDLPLFQGCLYYKPLRHQGQRSERFQRLRRTLSLRDSSSARSPECGNFGVTTKGNPTTVLRSYLARDDFIQRVYLNQVLYFQRYAPQQEPHPVLLVWIIDRGRPMQLRTTGNSGVGRRRDSLARQLMAYLIEDAVRHLQGLAAINLRVAVLLHDGDPNSSQANLILLPLEVLSRAPSVDSPNANVTWLPKVDGFLPEYFLREPVWPASTGKAPPATSNAPAKKKESYWQFLRWLGALGYQMDHDFAAVGNTFLYDLCHVAVFGPYEKMMANKEVQQSADLQGYLSGLAGHITFSFFAFNNTEITWTTRPKSSHMRTIVQQYSDSDWEENHLLRQTQWDHLMGLLQVL